MPDDVILASYPKSGTTWLTFMLAQLLWQAGREQTLVDDRFLPKVGAHRRAERRLPQGGRFIRSHERYRPAYRKAIYVVRDGRDVAVSFFFQAKRVMGMDAAFSEYLDLFLAGTLTGAGAWHRHVTEWLQSPAHDAGQVLVVRYEDMKTDAHAELRRCGTFLGANFTDELIADAIAAGSFESMRGRESQTKGLAHRESGEKIPVVRKGIVGDWQNHFSDDDLNKFIAVAGPAMQLLQYDCTAAPPAPPTKPSAATAS